MTGKFLLFIFLLLSSLSSFCFPEAKYLFDQQLNDKCAIAPMINLKLLEQMEQPDGSYVFPDSAYYSRREWFVLNFPYLRAWHAALDSINIPEEKKDYPGLNTYLEKAVEFAPIYPHFYSVEGNSILSDNLLTIFKEAQQIPYFFIDYNYVSNRKYKLWGLPLFSSDDFIPSLGILIPVAQEKQDDFFKIGIVKGTFPNKKVKWQTAEDLKTSTGLIDLSAYTEKKYQGLNHIKQVVIDDAHILGFDKTLRCTDLARGYLAPMSKLVYITPMQWEQVVWHSWYPQAEGPKEGTFIREFMHIALETPMVPYMIGLYKLMLLTLGITSTPQSFADKRTFEEGRPSISEPQKIEAESAGETSKEEESSNSESDKSTIIVLKPKERRRTRQAEYLTEDEKLKALTQKASSELQELMQKDNKNPWNRKFFSKSNFLQHTIAQLLKKNKRLFEEAKQTVDFYFSQWGMYSKYLNLMADGEIFGIGKKRYYVDLAKYFVPDEEYMLAYAITQNAWLLWLGSVNKGAFYKALTDSSNAWRGLLLGINWDGFKRKAYVQQSISKKRRISFIELWKKIVHKVKRKARKNWISFSGHGCVISFDNAVIAKQRETHLHDAHLFNDLMFTAIESWLAKELDSFYKMETK
jgi:hypothetical protein